MRNRRFRDLFCMDIPDLLALKPEELVAAIFERRRVLAEILPDIESKMAEDADILAPKVEKLRLARDAESNRVAELKKQRNDAQKEARDLLGKTRALRVGLEEKNGLKNLDPKWAKEKLEEKLFDIEKKIEQEALTLADERRLLAERKELLKKNRDWLEKRREDNPEMADYVDSSKKMSELFTQADKLHQEMLTHVEKNEPIHAEFVQKRNELRSTIRQLERARSLLKQSESAISFWERANLGDYGDLLDAAKRVEAGGKSTIRRRNADLPLSTKPEDGEEE